MNDNTEQFLDMFKDFAAETGYDFKDRSGHVAAIAAEQAKELASIVGEPGFEEAVRSASRIVLMEAGIAAMDAANELDLRLVGLVRGALGFAARALAP